jgi:superfamily II DNA/RNA helicase
MKRMKCCPKVCSGCEVVCDGWVVWAKSTDLCPYTPTGFQEQMYAIFQFLPPTIQIALFSATLPASAVQLANKFLRDPVRITIKQEDVTLEGIKQFYVDLGVGEDHGHHHRRHAASAEDALKLSTLIDLYESVSVSQCIIYANTRRRVCVVPVSQRFCVCADGVGGAG